MNKRYTQILAALLCAVLLSGVFPASALTDEGLSADPGVETSTPAPTAEVVQTPEPTPAPTAEPDGDGEPESTPELTLEPTESAPDDEPETAAPAPATDPTEPDDINVTFAPFATIEVDIPLLFATATPGKAESVSTMSPEPDLPGELDNIEVMDETAPPDELSEPELVGTDAANLASDLLT